MAAASRAAGSFVFLLLLLMTGSGVGCSDEPPAAATATPTRPPATLTSTATPVPTPTATATPEPTATATSEPTATPTLPPSTGAAARVLSRGPRDRMTVALTFDAGSDRGFAAQILDTLRDNGVVASFGITGQWAERNGDLVTRMGAEGHLLINHSYNHASFTGASTSSAPLTREQRWSQLDRTEALMQALSGRGAKPFFRPPYGDYDASVNRDLGARGYDFNVMWTIDSRGWLGIPAAEIVARCLQLAEPGAIYVFHVGAASADAQALPEILRGLRERGYSFVSVLEYAR